MEQWKRNLIFLSFSEFLVTGAWTLAMPFLPLYLAQDLGVQGNVRINFWTGLLSGAAYLPTLVAAPLWGKVADRYGRKIMILRAGVGVGTTVFLLGFVQNPGQMLVLLLIYGIMSGFDAGVVALLSTNSPREKIGFVLGIANGAKVGGSILGPLIGGMLAGLIGFRQIFHLTGAVLIFATVLVALFVKETNKPVPAETSSRMLADAKKVFSTGPLPALFVTVFLIQFALLSINPFIPIFVQQLDHTGSLSPFFVGLAVSLPGVASMIFSPIFGRLSDRIGARRILFFNLCATAAFLTPQALVGSYSQLLFWRFMFGISIGGLIPAMNSLIARHAPRGMESSTYGFSNSFFYAGMSLGPIIGGILGGVVGTRGGFLFAALLFFINTFWFRAHLIRSGGQNQKNLAL